MNFKKTLMRAVERLTGTHIYRRVPRGMDVFGDLAGDLPRFEASVVFDVGAHVGQSTQRFLTAFPGARIYCFEPVRETFLDLARRFRNEPRVVPNRLALGATVGSARMAVAEASDLSHVIAPGPEEPVADGGVRAEVVDLTTLDVFCRRYAIDAIHYLKVDAEGSDLAVLQGARELLREQRIDLVQVEAGMNPENTLHTPLEAFRALLHGQGYRLFGIYDQVNEWPSNAPHLRRANLVFISMAASERCAGESPAEVPALSSPGRR